MNNNNFFEPEYDSLNKKNKKKKFIFEKSKVYLITILLLFFSIILFFQINYIFKSNKDKDYEIQMLKKKLEQIIINSTLEVNKSKIPKKIEEAFSYDKEFFNNNFMFSSEDINKIGYFIMYQSHTIEKGMSHFKLRPFGKKKILSILNLLKKDLKYNNYQNDFSFINGINILREYKELYEKNKWKNRKEYYKITIFLENFKNITKTKTGAFTLSLDDLKKDYNINYKRFVKSRHSTRNYKNETLKLEDIKYAIDIARYSPSACNRQYIKVHYYPEGKMKNNIIDYSLGKGGIYLDGVNTFIITFDANGLISGGERNQGYFNAGLFSMNLVNAFHSLGIGTCFIQFHNSIREEKKLKILNKIPLNERIAVILYAGYYDKKSIFAKSPRKDIKDYFTLHK